MNDEIVERRREILTKLQGWPEVGDKIVFNGQSVCRFTNQIDNAAKLSVGSIYTISKIEVYSSSSSIWLEGFEGEFSLGMFEYEKQVPKNKEELEKELIELRDRQWRISRITEKLALGDLNT